MDIFALFTVILFAVVLAACLKKKNLEISMVFSIAVIVLVFMSVLNSIFPILDKVSSYGVSDELYLVIPLKILGISLFGKITGSLCDDAGEKGLSSLVSIIVKTSSVLVALPLFDKLLSEIGVVLTL